MSVRRRLAHIGSEIFERDSILSWSSSEASLTLQRILRSGFGRPSFQEHTFAKVTDLLQGGIRRARVPFYLPDKTVKQRLW